MSTSDFHERRFDEETQCKLDIYRQYLRSWLPVFLHREDIRSIQIFDFFAGPGHDGAGNAGSPVIASEEIALSLSKNVTAPRDRKRVLLYLNEPDEKRYAVLINETMPQIRKQNGDLEIILKKERFSSILQEGLGYMRKPGAANFVFLDQFGIKETTHDVLLEIWKCPTTDMMFFVSSSCVNRFKNDNHLQRYLPPLEPTEYGIMDGHNATRLLHRAYTRWIPPDMTYYLGQFSIKRNANIYGLIFGSRHPLGLDKFLQVAWNKDNLQGEANFDIDNDNISTHQLYLFTERKKSTKIKVFEQHLKDDLLKGNLRTNLELYLYGLRNGMLARHVREAVSRLQQEGVIPTQKLKISYDAWKNRHTENIRLGEITS